MSQGYLPGRSYGEIINRYEDAGLILSESIYRPDTIIDRHSHGHPYFCILLQGSYTETYGRQRRECKPSTVIFHPADELHSDHFLGKGGRLFRFEIKRQLLERISQCSATLSEPADFNGGLLARLASKLYQEFRQPDEVSSLVLEGLTLEMAAEMARKRQSNRISAAPSWLKRACELIHAQFAESLTLTDIAKPVGVHRSTWRVSSAASTAAPSGNTLGDCVLITPRTSFPPPILHSRRWPLTRVLTTRATSPKPSSSSQV